jgi:hypothetical protein
MDERFAKNDVQISSWLNDQKKGYDSFDQFAN